MPSPPFRLLSGLLLVALVTGCTETPDADAGASVDSGGSIDSGGTLDAGEGIDSGAPTDATVSVVDGGPIATDFIMSCRDVCAERVAAMCTFADCADQCAPYAAYILESLADGAACLSAQHAFNVCLLGFGGALTCVEERRCMDELAVAGMLCVAPGP